MQGALVEIHPFRSVRGSAASPPARGALVEMESEIETAIEGEVAPRKGGVG